MSEVIVTTKEWGPGTYRTCLFETGSTRIQHVIVKEDTRVNLEGHSSIGNSLLEDLIGIAALQPTRLRQRHDRVDIHVCDRHIVKLERESN